jgi:predicted PurR-regulated permease PerM
VLLLLSASLWIVLPFVPAVIWGAIIAISIHPLFLRLVRLLRGRRVMAAILIGLLLAVTLFLPLTILVFTISDHVGAISAYLSQGNTVELPSPPPWVEKIPLVGARLHKAWIAAVSDLAGTLETLRPRVREAILWLLSQILTSTVVLFEAALAIVLSTIFLLNATRLRTFFLLLVERLGASDSLDVVATIEKTTRSISKGILGTAVIPAVLAWIGLVIAGAPAPILLAFFCFVLFSMQLGMVLVGIPVALWLWAQGDLNMAILLVIWSVVVSVLDNALKPILLGQDFPVPIWLLFMGIIGGMLAMGLIGLFIGPIILSISFQLIMRWTEQGR